YSPHLRRKVHSRRPLEEVVDTDEMLRAVIEFLHTWRETAPSNVRTSWGTIYRDARFPLIHAANLGWVSSLPPHEGPKQILDDLTGAFRGSQVPHQALLFEDAEQAFAVQEDFVRLGLRPTAELAMAKVGLPQCIVNPDLEIHPAAEGAAEIGFRSVMTATESALGHAPEVVEQMWGLRKDRSGRVGMRSYLGSLNGTPAGTISVWPRGKFAWIDDVATHPDFRMRGVGRTMIFEACKRALESGCEWVVLISDLFDTPQIMYKTLGFEPIGEVRGFLRE
ncbi:MAG: GNAT family N-acetyltransferase, partial [Thermoplasmata archaeon]|nr:GNAT family N-acetyltransferase [Thermoplasmata archaeon]